MTDSKFFKQGLVDKSLKKWTVHKNGEVLGLFSAQEIRAKLRDGAVDPFDLVSEEGSNLQIELVEVSEIFTEGLGQEAETPANSTVLEPGPNKTSIDKITVPKQTQGGLDDGPIGGVEEKQPPSEERDPHLMPSDSFKTSPHARALGDEKSKKAEKAARAKVKNYMLIDQNKKELGPLSPDEIQSLYKRGILADSVKVMSQKSGKKVSVRQFLNAYSGKRIKALQDKGAGQKRYSSSRALNELYQLVSTKNLSRRTSISSGLTIALIGVLLGFALIGFMDFRDSKKSSSERRSVSGETSKKSAVKKKRRLKRSATVKKTRSKARSRRTAKKEKSVKRRTKKKRLETKRVVKPATRSVKKVVPRRPGVVAMARKKAGQLQTIGPVTYSKAALERCVSRCVIKFTDSQGSIITAIFFKGAFYDDLVAKGTTVKLHGSTKMSGSQLQIFIQDVR